MKSSLNTSTYHVRCFTHPSQNFCHLSYVYAGLCALESTGLALVTYERPSESVNRALCPVAVWVEATDTRTNQERRIVFEMSDHSDWLATDLLSLCDVYFKRSYHAPHLECLSAELKARILPFGLIYPCKQANSSRRVLSSLLSGWTSDIVKSPTEFFRRILRWDLRSFLMSPRVSAFEHPPDFAAERAVHFQSRVWEPELLGPDSEEEVNQFRAKLIRLLKHEFGSSFDGGIVPTKYTRRNFANDLCRGGKRRCAYVEHSKKMLIGVYTRGLHHSIGFKLAEYLASSKCIIMEPLRHQLPTPLVPGRNYLDFSTPEECVQQCIKILNDREFANRMRTENWDYYQREVRPDRRIASCLVQAFRQSFSPHAQIIVAARSLCNRRS